MWIAYTHIYFNFVNGALTNPLLCIYQYHRDNIHEHNTRHSTRQNTDLRTPFVNSEIKRKGFLFQGPQLLASLKVSRTNSSCTTRLMFNCIDNYWYAHAHKMLDLRVLGRCKWFGCIWSGISQKPEHMTADGTYHSSNQVTLSGKWWCFRPLLCTLFRLNWAKQTPGIMRRN